MTSQCSTYSFASPKPVPNSLVTYPNATFSTFHDILVNYLGSIGGGKIVPSVVILACAGPVKYNQVRMTATNWLVRGDEVKDILQEMRDYNAHKDRNQMKIPITVRIINDFKAQGYGVLSLPASSLINLNPHIPPMRRNGPKVVVGPGTGLGFCYLTSDVEEGDVGEADEIVQVSGRGRLEWE